MFGGNFAPAGWMFCDGQLLPISENETLFNLIGTTYGGDGQSTFALPDLRGRIPLHQGNGFILAENGRRRERHADRQPDPGAHATRLARRPPTTHRPRPQATRCSRPAAATITPYVDRQRRSSALEPSLHRRRSGGSQPHNNFQPYLCVDFIISLFGIFPSQT